MTRTSFMSHRELAKVGFADVGRGILVSKFARVYQADCISLGDHVRIDDFCILSGGAGIRIGSYVHIAAYTVIYGGGGVTIGDFTNLSSRVGIYSESDDFSGKSLVGPLVPRECRRRLLTAPVRVDAYAVVGAVSTILPGVVLHEGAVVGAHSLVTKACPEWTICAGVPAVVIKRRSRLLLTHKKLLTELRRRGYASASTTAMPRP